MIVPCYKVEGARFPDYCEIDLSIATENLWLEAASLGLGAVWIGTAPLKDRMEKQSFPNRISALHQLS